MYIVFDDNNVSLLREKCYSVIFIDLIMYSGLR